MALANPVERVTITITNFSGETQSYAIFANVPTVTPNVKEINNDVITVFRGVASGGGGKAFFSMPKSQLCAICGASNRDGSAAGLQSEVMDHKPIKLGLKTDEGKVVPGTTCEIVIVQGSPSFSQRQTMASLGNTGSFCIQTKGDFTYREAKINRYVIGFGIMTKPEMTKDVGPFALFCPMPNQLYQIKPSTIFFVVAGEHEPRETTGRDFETTAFKFDLEQLESNDVALVHDSKGMFSVKLAQPVL